MAEDDAIVPNPDIAATDLARQYRLHISKHMPLFALCAIATTSVSLLVLVLDGLVPFWRCMQLIGLQAGALAGTAAVCRGRPAARHVPMLAMTTCVLIALSLTLFFARVHGDAALLGFMLLILAITSALLFAWRRPTAVTVLIVGVIAPWMLLGRHFKLLGSLNEVRGALVAGSLVYLAIAEYAGRAFRSALRHRLRDRETARALAASRDAYRDLAETARDLIFAADMEGRFTYVNPAGADFIGEPAVALIGRSSYEFVSGHPTNPTIEALTERNLRGQLERPFILEVRTARGQRWVETTLANVRHADGRLLGVRGISRDVSERHAAELALQDATERFDLALKAAGVGTWSWNIDRDAITWDESLCHLFGRSPGTFPTTFEDFLCCVHPDDGEALRSGVLRALEAGREYNNQFRIVWPDGSVRVMASRGAVWRGADDAAERLTGVCWDVTDQCAADAALRASLADLRRSEEQIRRLARRQATVRDQERKRLSVDLHDNICQELVGIAILIESARQRLPPMPAEAAASFDRGVRYLNQLVEHLRLLAHDLRPMALSDLGLEGSLRTLAESMSTSRPRIDVVFRTPLPRLDEVTEIAVYRIAQEALTNAVRHAQCDKVELVFGVEDDTLELEVRDDGRGFAAAARRTGSGSGLLSMEERALAIGARVEVTSHPGTGTTIRLVCPIPGERLRVATRTRA